MTYEKMAIFKLKKYFNRESAESEWENIDSIFQHWQAFFHAFNRQ